MPSHRAVLLAAVLLTLSTASLAASGSSGPAGPDPGLPDAGVPDAGEPAGELDPSEVDRAGPDRTGPDRSGLDAPDVAIDRGERWIVGFTSLDEAEIADGEWQGHNVVSVNEAIAFALVEVEDPVGFHLEDRHRETVAYVEREDPGAYTPLVTPDDPRYDEQYGFPQIGAPAAWNVTMGASTVNVSVVDSGIDQDHEDLQATVADQRDFVSDDGVADDTCGHGTHVAGTVSANTDNGVGVAGTADGVDLLVAKALSSSILFGCTGSASDIADAITWSADNGADVISLSLGSSSASDTIGNAVEYAWSQDVLLVAAAGNSGSCTDCVSYPAAREEVVAVTCTNAEREQCSFSSQGSQAELAAPGNDVLSTQDGGGYTEMSGTSMSAPHVSGAAGLALSLDPTLTPSELRDLFNTTARDLGDLGHDPVFGHGELDVASLLSTVDPGHNQPPVAAFDDDCTELNCTFDASSSIDPDGSIVERSWRLGDGTSANGTTVDHSYAEAGSFDVELTVVDDEGANDTTTREITVSQPPAGALFAEDFDDGQAAGFSLGGLWHVSEDCEQPPTAPSYLGYHEETACSYDTGARTTGSASFTVDTTGASQPTLTFQHRWQTESTSCGIISCDGYDHMRLEENSDGTWTTLEEWTSLDDDQLSWTQASYELTGDVADVDVRFVFDTRDGVDNDHEGWFVDDVRVEDEG